MDQLFIRVDGFMNIVMEYFGNHTGAVWFYNVFKQIIRIIDIKIISQSKVMTNLPILEIYHYINHP